MILFIHSSEILNFSFPLKTVKGAFARKIIRNQLIKKTPQSLIFTHLRGKALQNTLPGATSLATFEKIFSLMIGTTSYGLRPPIYQSLHTARYTAASETVPSPLSETVPSLRIMRN